ncbi:lamin tail domain-containing protein [Roseibacillus persicicus]|uniref:lamin tail domain-containing protein n=1 Tax=Roseibacillus persicicus TaxID=454148 RepID=UPI00398A7B72
MKNISLLLLSTAAFSSTQAALMITEVMSSSSHAGGAANGDWFELTNTGSLSVDLTGYYWDDDGATGNDGALFPAITLLPSESIVIVAESIANIPDFVAAWGGGFTAYSEELFSGNDPFSGLGSGGDQIEIWDSDPNVGPANLVASATFGTATEGSSFEWDTSGTSLDLSIAGENGAFVAISDGADPAGAGTDAASPGFAVVPEASSAALLLLGLLPILRRRR